MHPGYFPVFFWSLLILISFWGYGELLRRRLNRPEFSDLGWGLTCAWGMAVVLALGGVLMALHLAKAPVLTSVVLFGAATAFYYLANALTTESPKPKKGKSGKAKASALNLGSSGFQFCFSDLVLYLLAALAFASSIAWPHHIDPNDDLICYLMLPEKLLCTGTLIEPFSFQRAGTFGGQSILQALVMIVGAERNGHIPDRGMAMLIIFGILFQAMKDLRGRYALAGLLLLLAFWFVPVPRISTNGAMTGGAMLLAMLVTLQRALGADAKTWPLFLPAAILLAGTCSVRPTFTVTAGLILAALALQDVWRGSLARKPFAESLTPYFVVGLGAFLILIPFMVVLYQSNGTPMVPPFSGFVSKAYQTYAFNEFPKDWEAVPAFFAQPSAWSMVLILLLAAVLPSSFSSVAVVSGLLLAGIVILHRFSALAFLDLYRYLYPIYVPLGLWMLAGCLNSASQNALIETKRRGATGALVAVISVVVIFMAVNSRQGVLELREQAINLPLQLKEVAPFFDPKLEKSYAHLQSLVPPGEKILTMVDASYWFDYHRNPIFSINAVGGSSPPPGIPFEKGPEALAAYFKGLGIRYIIAVDFNNAVLLYTRRLWNESTRPEWFYSAIWKPRFNDFMDNIDALAGRGGGLVATSANARLIDLGP